MVANPAIPKNVEFADELRTSPLEEELVTATSLIPVVFEEDARTYQFLWSRPVNRYNTKQLELSAIGPEAKASILINISDLPDGLQVQRKIVDLRWDLARQLTRKSIEELNRHMEEVRAADYGDSTI